MGHLREQFLLRESQAGFIQTVFVVVQQKAPSFVMHVPTSAMRTLCSALTCCPPGYIQNEMDTDLTIPSLIQFVTTSYLLWSKVI